jgi:hypothetical protein
MQNGGRCTAKSDHCRCVSTPRCRHTSAKVTSNGYRQWVFNAATGEDIDSDPNPILYAIMSGVTGWIAYEFAQRVMEGYDRP